MPSPISTAGLTEDEKYAVTRILDMVELSFMNRRLRADHLECGATVDSHCRSIEGAVAAERATLKKMIVAVEKLRVGVLRSDDRSGEGIHWVLLLQVATRFLLVDTTHLQYELPRAIDHASPDKIKTADKGAYKMAYTLSVPAVFLEETRDAAIQAWRTFLQQKKYVSAVRDPVSYPSLTTAAHGVMASPL
ncbi:MAG: hypothetical protein ABIQ44_02520 [Chloroflexia bacterium]